MRRAWRFLRTLAKEFSDNDLTNVAALLAYWASLALVPFLMFLLTVLGYLPLKGTANEVMSSLYRVAPAAAAKVLDGALREIVGQQRGWLLLVTLAGALWTASSGMTAVITALNRVYDVRETRPYWKTKLLGLVSTLAAIVLIAVALVGMILGPDLMHALWARFGLGGAFDDLWKWLRWPVVWLAMMLMLANTYYFLPNVKNHRWRFITPGAVVAVTMWIAASLAFRVYVTHFNSYAKTYGALGAIVILLTWVYLSCLSVILGGQVNAILDRQVKHIDHEERQPGPTTRPDTLQPA